MQQTINIKLKFMQQKLNKKLSQFLVEKGLTVRKYSAYGAFDGYETNVFVAQYDVVRGMQDSEPLKFHLAFYASEEEKDAMVSEIRANFLKKKTEKQPTVNRMNVQKTPFGIIVGIYALGKNEQNLPMALDDIVAVLNSHNAKGVGYCPVCGEPLDFATAQKRNIDGVTVSLGADCLQNINEEINEENKAFDEAPNNYGKGIVGALLGGLAGVAVCVVLYLIGFIAALSAFVSVIVGAKLWEKFGGKKNKVMVLCVAVTTFVMMILAVFVIYFIGIAVIMSENNISGSVVEYFASAMQTEEFSSAFVGDLVMNILFSVIGSIYELVQLNKSVGKRNNI